MIVGLTGSIATGKSTVSKFLREMNIPVIDADIVSREVVEKGTKGLSMVVEEFGQDVLLESGDLNRAKLGEIIFSDVNKRDKLNAILHPLIRNEMNRLEQKYVAAGNDIVVLDVPLLIENLGNYTVDEIWVVYVDEETQLTRLQMRNGFSLPEAKQRIESQLSIEKKKEFANRIIDNRGSEKETRQQIEEIIREIRKK